MLDIEVKLMDLGGNGMNSFFSDVYKIVAKIPQGKVATYGQIAAMLGHPRGARTVGWAMQSTPSHLKLPCHRVVNRSGKLAPYYVFDGEDNQRALLESEGICFTAEGCIKMKNHIWQPDIEEMIDS